MSDDEGDDDSDDDHSYSPAIDNFKTQAHSLRIPASRVAALAGYHPYSVLPEMFLDLVYQGRLGRRLKRQDAGDLSLSLVSEDELLLSLARKASAATVRALQVALEGIRRGGGGGEATVDDVRMADTVKKEVIQEARRSNKLEEHEIQRLKQGVRERVNQGCGVNWETEALDVLEKRYGWQVRDRNTQVLELPFVRAEDVLDMDLDQQQLHHDQEAWMKTVIPMARATPRRIEVNGFRPAKKARRSHNNNNNKTVLYPPESNSESDSESDSDSVSVLNSGSRSGSDSNQHKSMSHKKTTVGEKWDDLKPFFVLCGAVDGIREELWFPPPSPSPSTPPHPHESHNSIKPHFDFRKVIVECKHRMKTAFKIPPLYDQIQTVAYCLMYNIQEADLIQVVRRTTQNHHRAQDHTQQRVHKQINPKLPLVPPSSPPPVHQGDDQPKSWNHSDGVRRQEYIEHEDGIETPVAYFKVDQVREHMAGAGTEVKAGSSEYRQTNMIDFFRPTKHNTRLPRHVEHICTETQETVIMKTQKQKQKQNYDDCPRTCESDDAATHENSDQVTPLTIDIVVSRISLKDRVMNYKHNWDSIILPRLRSFIDAVYRTRADDKLRKLFLQVVSREQETGYGTLESWDLLHYECPWLKDCNTVHRRPNSSG